MRVARCEMRDARCKIQDAGYSNTIVWNQVSSLQTLCSVGVFGDNPVNGDFGGFFVFTHRDTGTVSLHHAPEWECNIRTLCVPL